MLKPYQIKVKILNSKSTIHPRGSKQISIQIRHMFSKKDYYVVFLLFWQVFFIVAWSLGRQKIKVSLSLILYDLCWLLLSIVWNVDVWKCILYYHTNGRRYIEIGVSYLWFFQKDMMIRVSWLHVSFRLECHISNLYICFWLVLQMESFRLERSWLVWYIV